MTESQMPSEASTAEASQRTSYWEAPDEPAGPAPGFAFGGFGARLIAYIVDVLVIAAAVIVFFLITLPFAYFGAGSSGLSPAEVIAVLFYVILLFGYFPWFWSRSGSTPGMRLMHLRVVRDSDGMPISVGQAILRLIGYFVSGWILYLGFIWIFIDKRRRGWHDLIAGTVVIKEL